MAKKILCPFLLSLLVLFSTACPDPGASNEDDPSRPDNENAEEMTQDQVLQLVTFATTLTGSRELCSLAEVEGSGILFEGTDSGSVMTINDYDISGIGFNSYGFLTLSGTVTEDYSSLLTSVKTIDLSLTGGEISHIRFSYGTLSEPAPVTVTVDDWDYTVTYPVDPSLLSDGIPAICGIFSDTNISTVIHTPIDWDLPHPVTFLEGTAADGGLNQMEPLSGIYLYDGGSYPYDLSCFAEVPEDPRSSAIKTNARISARGFLNNRGTEFQATGAVDHYVYFIARSDHPDTTRITLSFDLTSTGRLLYDIEEGEDYVYLYASQSVDATLSRMGWVKGEMGGYSWAHKDFIASLEGQAALGGSGGDGLVIRNASGLFEGDLDNSSKDVSLYGSETLSCTIVPEDEMMCMTMNLRSHAKIQFTGTQLSFTGMGKAKNLEAELSYDYRAEDPDHPEAKITVDFIIPEF